MKVYVLIKNCNNYDDGHENCGVVAVYKDGAEAKKALADYCSKFILGFWDYEIQEKEVI